jgi:hypothetical protein
MRRAMPYFLGRAFLRTIVARPRILEIDHERHFVLRRQTRPRGMHRNIVVEKKTRSTCASRMMRSPASASWHTRGLHTLPTPTNRVSSSGHCAGTDDRHVRRHRPDQQ